MNLITEESIMKHGIEVVGTKENFISWLQKENILFDKNAPIEFNAYHRGH